MSKPERTTQKKHQKKHLKSRWKNRIYILPTRFGLVFIIGSVLMILIGSAYQNNLVNLLAFFMLSLIFICMIQTHNNLKDVAVEAFETEGGFAGGEFLVTTVLANGAREPRFGLETRLRHPRTKSVYGNVLAAPAKGRLKIRAAYPATQRGRFALSEARVSSVYPLGLFEAWAWFDANGDYFVYPALKGERPLPRGEQDESTGHTSHPDGGDDFHGHRKFKDGDSHRHVDWKAYARGRPLMVKEFTEGAPGTLRFTWSMLEGVETEARLSQLAAWIEEARRTKSPFALELPGASIPPGEGIGHATRCWEALAAHGKEGV